MDRETLREYHRNYKAQPEVHDNKRECDICGAIVKEYQYQNHKIKYHKDSEYCEFCDKSYKYLKSHLKTEKHKANIPE